LKGFDGWRRLNKGRNRKVLLLKLRRKPRELERVDVQLENYAGSQMPDVVSEGKPQAHNCLMKPERIRKSTFR